MTKTPQMKKLEWERFLEELAANDQFPEQQRLTARKLWQDIVRQTPSAMIPTVRYQEKSICFSWIKRPLSMEIEFLHDGSASWFFTDEGNDYENGSTEPVFDIDHEALFFTLMRLFKKVRLRGRGGGS
jgi:hypothetical protein